MTLTEGNSSLFLFMTNCTTLIFERGSISQCFCCKFLYSTLLYLDCRDQVQLCNMISFEMFK